MKRVVVVLLVLLLCAAAASAAQDNWRINVKADDGAGGAISPSCSLGVYPTSSDGLDPQDGSPYPGLTADEYGITMHVATPIDGQLYLKNIKAPTLPDGVKTWDFFVAANVNSTAGVIRLYAVTVNSTALPTSTFDGQPVAYSVKMIDNKGMAGAPANGTIWQVPIPTTHSNTIPFWTAPINLPVIKLSAKANSAFIAEGYRLQLIETAVPEPSSLLALGAGLVGLAGVIRRRR